MPPPLRYVIDFFLKAGVMVVVYTLLTSMPDEVVILGLAIVAATFVVNVNLVFRWILHPKSVLRRQNILYRKDPCFMRLRLMLELVRRLVYFAVIFGCTSYGLQRLNGSLWGWNTAADIPIFIQHVYESFVGMTSLGTHLLTPTTAAAACFEMVRVIFTCTVFAVFVGITIAGFVHTKTVVAKDATHEALKELLLPPDTVRREDIKSCVELVLERELGIKPADVKADLRLIEDLGADSLELIQIQVDLEGIFETGELLESEVTDIKTVGNLVDLFSKKLQTKKVIEKASSNPSSHKTK